MLKSVIRSSFSALGYEIRRRPPADAPHVYAEDGLRTDHCHDFMQDSRFMGAYAVGRRAMGDSYHAMHWRAHVLAWCGR